MKPSKHLSRFLDFKCHIDILKILYGNLNQKEITECMSVFNFLRTWMYNNTDIDYIVDCGSGKFSVLGLIYAFHYNKAHTISIDPREDLRIDLSDDVRGFNIVKGYLNDLNISSNSKVLLLCNHSHSSEREAKCFLSQFNDWAYLTVPCCKDNTLSNTKCISYRDTDNWSAKNKIYFYTKNGNYENI